MHPLNRVFRCIVQGLLLLVSLALLPWSRFAGAQEPPPPQVESIQPAEGAPGDQIEATIFGNGFDQEVEIIVEGVDVEVLERSEQAIAVLLHVPGDAPPGPRDVIAINHVGAAQRDVLPGGFVVRGQEPPPLRLETIEPAAGEPGQRLGLTLWGEGFGPEMAVALGDGIVEEGREFIDDGTLRLEVRILDDAPPGPRAVEVWNPETDQSAALPQGFFVRGAVVEPTPPPVEEDGGVPWGIVGPLAGLLGLIGASVVAYLGLDAARRGRVGRRQKELEQWQEEAQQELPRQCRPGTRLPIVGRRVKSDTWQIVHLVFAVQASAAGQPYDDQHTVGGKIVRRLNEVVALRQRTNDEDRLRRMAAPQAKELARLLWVWTQKGARDRPVAVEAKVEGQVTYTFKLYECQKTEQGNRWKEIKDWEGAVKETDTLAAGDLVGPQERERKGRFQKRATEALTELLLRLTSGVQSMA
jgi:hypothetical protein